MAGFGSSWYCHCQFLYEKVITESIKQWLRFRPDGTATFFLPVPSIVIIDNRSDDDVEHRYYAGVSPHVFISGFAFSVFCCFEF